MSVLPRSRLALVGSVLVVGVVAGVLSCNSPLFGCKDAAPDPSVAIPDSFVVRFTTNRGPFDVMARKAWAPIGVSRFYELAQGKHFDENRFFRVIKGFVVQFGLSGDPKESASWRRRCMPDEPVKHQNERGTLAFARSGRGKRSTQLFVNLVDNTPLDTTSGFGFPPIGQVISGMQVVDSLYSEYGEPAPRAIPRPGYEGPTQDSIAQNGNAYLISGWPKLDYIQTARIVHEWPAR